MKKNAFLLGLMIAIYYIIKLYGQAGIEVMLNDTEQTLVNGKLIQAAKDNDYNKIVMLLSVDAADVNAVDQDGKTALMWAALNSNTSAVEKLIGFKPNVDLQDNDGNTAAHLALLSSPDQIVSSEERVNSNDYKVLRMIFAAGEDPNIRNKTGKTILDLAQDKEVQDRMTRETIKMIRRYLAKHGQNNGIFKKCAHTSCAH